MTHTPRTSPWFRALLGTLPDAVMLAQADGMIVFANAALERIMGYSSAALLGQPYSVLVAEPYQAHVATLYSQYAADATEVALIQAVDTELACRRSDGSEFSAALSLRLLQMPDSGALLIAITLHDLSERRRLEQELQSSREQLGWAANIGGLNFWETNLRTGAGSMSGQIATLVGGKRGPNGLDTIPIADWASMMHPDDLERNLAHITEMNRNPATPPALEYRVLLNNGQIRWFRAKGAIIEYDDQHQMLRAAGTAEDITEQKQTEAELRASQQRIELAASAGGISFLELDIIADEGTLSGHITTLLADEDMLNGRELIAVSEWRSLIHPDDRERVAKLVQHNTQVANDENLRELQYRILIKNGQIRWIYSRVAIIARNEYGRPTRLVGTIQDVTERMAADAAVQRERDKAQRYLDITGVMFLVIDRECKITMINREGARILGYPESEIIGADWFDRFAPERDRVIARTEFSQLMHADMDSNYAYKVGVNDRIIVYEAPILTRDGEKMLRWHASLIADESGQIISLLVSGDDITERQQAESAVQHERDKAQQYLDIAGVMLIGMNNTGRVTMINREGARMLGYPESEIIGTDWFDRFIFEQHRVVGKLEYARLMQGQLIQNLHGTVGMNDHIIAYESPICTKDGEKYVRWHVALIIDETGQITGTLSSGEDITARKQTETALQQAYRTIAHSQQQLQAIMDHAPLTIFTKDLSGRYILTNPRFNELLGLKEGQSLLGYTAGATKR